MTEVRTDSRYEVLIRRPTFGSGPSYKWTVVAPDGRTQSGDTFSPAWLWVARWSARKAARRLLLTTETDVVERYFLRPALSKGKP